MGMPSTYNQIHFRIRSADDTALNTDSGWAATEDNNATIGTGNLFRIRFRVTETAGGTNATTFKLQVSRNGGGFVDVGLLGTGTAPAVIARVSGQYTDGAPTSTQLLTTGGGTYTNGEGLHDNQTGSYSLSNQETELEWCIQILGFHDGPTQNVAGNTLEFRVVENDNTVFTGTYTNPTVTVSETPGYIGGTFVEHPVNIGPIKDSNGNLYTIIEASVVSNSLLMIKSTDGGDTWREMDAANRPTQTDIECVDIDQDGDTLHILHVKNAVYYHRFRTSSHPTNPDTWEIVDESVDGTVTAHTTQAGSIHKRSDNTIVAFYIDAAAPDRCRYKIRNGTWGSQNTVDTEGGVNFVSPWCVLGANDKIHIIYKDDTNGIIYHRSLDSGNVLSARETIATGLNTAVAGDNIPFLPPVYYDSSGNEKVMIIYQKVFGNGPIYHRAITNDGAPGAEVQVSDNNVEQQEGGNNMVIASAAVDGTTVHVFYSRKTVLDIFRTENANEGGWSTDVQENANVLVHWIRGNVFTHSSGNGGAKVFGYTYDNFSGGGTGQIWYAEYVIAAGGTEVTSQQPLYLRGQAGATSQQPLYLKGQAQASNQQPLYLTGSAPSVIDIDGNRGRITFNDSSQAFGRAIAAYATHQSDAEAYMSFQFATTDNGGLFRIWLRGSHDWADWQTPTQGYELEIANTGNWKLYRVQGGTRTQIGTTVTWSATTGLWWLRFHCNGSDIRARIWADGGAEPSAWDREIDDTVSGFTTAGILQLGYFRVAGSRTVHIDDLSYDVPTTAAGASSQQPLYLRGQASQASQQPIYLAGQIAIASQQPLYLAAQAQASSQQPIYLAGQDSATSQLPIYLEGVAGASSQQPIYLAGVDTATAQQPLYLLGQDQAIAQQPLYLAGQNQAVAQQPLYLAGVDTATAQQPIFLLGQATVASSQPLYLAGQQQATAQQPLYLAGIATDTSQQPLYLAGAQAAQSSQSLYLAGTDTATSAQPLYLAGVAIVTSQQPIYLEGVAGATSQQPLYLLGQAQATSSQPIYLRGQEQATNQQPLYLAGQQQLASQQPIYLAGVETTTSSQPIYLAGGIIITSQQSLYLAGSGVAVSSQQPLYLAGSDVASSQQAIYTRGQEQATDQQPLYLTGSQGETSQQPIYLRGQVQAAASQPIYLRGADTATSQQPIYLDAVAGASSQQPLYLAGVDTATSQQALYLLGANVAQGQQPIYLKGVAGIASQQPIYLAGVDTATSTQPIYVLGQASAISQQPLYLAGVDTATSQQAIFLRGQAAAQDQQPLYLLGRAIALANQPIYLSGVDTATSQQPIYLEGGGFPASSSQSIYLVGKLGELAKIDLQFVDVSAILEFKTPRIDLEIKEI